MQFYSNLNKMVLKSLLIFDIEDKTVFL